MSATTEQLLQQILEIEDAIKINLTANRNVDKMQEQLNQLKEMFQLMNETLNESSKILKG